LENIFKKNVDYVQMNVIITFICTYLVELGPAKFFGDGNHGSPHLDYHHWWIEPPFAATVNEV
jgi:hypothetical protein